MSMQARRLGTRSWSPGVVEAAAIGGVVAGLVLVVLTAALGALDSLSGGSGDLPLVVPLGIAPALVAAGWCAIVLHGRRHAHWGLLASTVGLAGIILASVVNAVPDWSTAHTVLAAMLWAWMGAAPLVALVFPRGHALGAHADRWDHLAAVFVYPAAMFLGVWVLATLR
jgi:hypothetical protein